MSNAMFAMGQAAGSSYLPGAWDIAYAYYDPPEGLAWNISTAEYMNKSFSVTTGEITPQSVFFKPDGIRMYLVGRNNDTVEEYTLSVAWDISTASYSQGFSITTQEANPSGLFFKPDGTKFYIIGVAGDDVNEYNLSTPWNVSTASYVQTFYVGVQETNPNTIFFKPDGTKFYIVGSVTDRVYEYNLSTAWDVSTASYLQNFSVATQDTFPTGLFFKPDGTKMYVLGSTGDDVNEYNLSTPWDISTASYVQVFSVAAQDADPQGIFFKPDGTKMYMVGNTNDTIYQYALGGFSVNPQEATPYAVFFKPDGTKMYIMGTLGDDVNEYNLSTPWNVSTASYVQVFSVSTQDTIPTSLFFKPDGTKMYVLGNSADNVYEYSLSTAWSVSTASYVRTFYVGPQELVPQGLFFKSDGTKMYITGGNGDEVNEYNLSTPWDISTASYLQLFSVAAQDGNPSGVFFRPDGAKMYVLGTQHREVYEYTLSTPWDVSTASYVQLFSVADLEATPNGFFFKDDGTKMFIVGQVEDRVFTFTLLNDQ